MQPFNKNMKRFCDFRDPPDTMSGKPPEKCYDMKIMTIITQVQVQYGLISAMLLWLILSFSCEVYVKVDPAAEIRVVQNNITALLSLEFSYNFCSLKSDPNNISILPMGKHHSYRCMCHMKSLYLHVLFMNTLCIHKQFFLKIKKKAYLKWTVLVQTQSLVGLYEFSFHRWFIINISNLQPHHVD